MSSLGESIKTARINRKMTQEDLAHALNITKAAVSRYELNKRQPSFEQLKAIAHVLNVDIYELLTGESKDIYFQAEVDMVLMNAQQGYSYSETELRLISAFSKLNEDGHNKAVERVEELTEIPKYQKESAPVKQELRLHAASPIKRNAAAYTVKEDKKK